MAFPLLSYSTDYYFQGGNMNSLANWNTVSDGSGIPAPNGAFSDPTHNWNINGETSGTVAANWTLAGDLDASTSFIIDLNSGVTFIFSGDFINYNNVLINGAGSNIVGFDGTSDNICELANISTLELGGNTTKFARANLNISTLLLADNSSLDMLGQTLSLTTINAPTGSHVIYTQSGDSSALPSVTYPSTTLVVYSSGAGNQFIPSGAVFEAGLTLSDGATKVYYALGNFTTNGTLQISGSSTLNMKTFKVDGTGTLSGIGTSSFLTAYTGTDPYPDNSTFRGIQYEGASNQYIPDGTVVTNNLILSMNDTVFANGSLEVDNTINFLGNSSLDMGTGQLTGTVATVTFSGTHTFRTAHLTTLPYPDDLDFSNSGMTVEFYGTGSQLIPGGTSATHKTIYNLVLGGSGTKQLTSSRYLTIGNSGGALTIEPGVSLLTGSGTELLLNGCAVTLEANATSSGQFYCDGTLNTSNSPTISRQTYLDLSSSRYYNISTGITGASLSTLAEPGASIVANSGATGSVWYWDATTSRWEAPANTTDAVDPKVGYTIFGGSSNGTDFLRSGTGTISADGTGINNSDVAITLSYHDGTNSNASLFAGGASGWGWNLIANPFTATYDWNGQSFPSNTNNAIYIWNGTNYSSFVNGVPTNQGSRYIPPGQAFWVQTTATPDGNLTLPYGQTDPTNNTSILKTNPDHVKLHLSNTSGEMQDEIAVRFDPTATASFDAHLDAHKLGAATGVPYVYIMQDHEAYSICSTTDSIDAFEVYVKNNGGPAQLQFSLSSDDLRSFSKVYLEDTKSNTLTLLSDGSTYTFQHLDTDASDRFRLLFAKSGVELPESYGSKITASVDQGMLYLFNTVATESIEMELIDIAGRPVASMEWNNAPISVAHLPTGVYHLIWKNRASQTQGVVKVVLP